MSEARAIQRTARQSPYKMRLVIDQVRGMNCNEALALLKFSKKHAAKQIEKVLKSAIANAEQASRNSNESIDVDALFVKKAIVNEGPPLKRFMLQTLTAQVGWEGDRFPLVAIHCGHVPRLAATAGDDDELPDVGL